VSETLQLEELTQMHDAPRLLVEWSPRWDEFVTSIRPALSRSTARLAGEAPFGLIPYRVMLASCALELFLIFLAVVTPIKLAQLHPDIAPKLTGHDVIYYSGDELPRTEDLGGSHAGASGRAGGRVAHHRTQTIKIARGGSLVAKVLDAPRLKLPASPGAVANLLAIRPDAGPPPTEGLRSSRSVPNLPTSVIAPVPSVSRDRVLFAPVLNSAVVPPAPSVSSDRTRSMLAVTPNVIPPVPEVSRDRTLVAPSLDASIVAPAPNVSRDAAHARFAPALPAAVVPPAPAVASRDISRSPVQMANAAVVPPPVSSPEREGVRNPKLTMPAPSVVAPPPSADMSQDLRRLASGSVPDLAKNVVPPPPTAATGTSFVGSLLSRVFGGTAVVPPPPTVSGGSSSRAAAGSLATNVVPPPPATTGSSLGPAGARAGASGPALAANVVPPPPSLGKGDAPIGSGRGATGSGLGSPLDAGSVLAPSGRGGNGADASIVVSKDPGPKVGLPANAKPGALAMSPAGGDKPGLGGSGGGSGLVHGEGSGSALNGAGTGGGKAGNSHGSDPNARAGVSATPGPGGAGNATSGTPAVSGVSVAGGSSMVKVDFGSNVGSGDPSLAGRSSLKDKRSFGVSVQSTARSGGAFNLYHYFPGATRTIYLDTSPPGVITYSEPAPVHKGSGNLADPEPIHTDLPAGLPHSQLVVACVLDASGSLKNLHVLEAGPAEMTAKVMAVLPGWKFSPVMMGNQPVEVNAIVGFNIDTSDPH
jgi:hypothetical protein